VIGVASAGPQAERYVEETAVRGDGRPGWGGIAPAGFTRGRCARDAVGVWLVQVGLDELSRFPLASEPRIEGPPASPTPGAAGPVLVTLGTGGWAAREARPVSTGVERLGDCTAIAGVRRQPACGA
jgi:hypothetical protein